MGRVARAGTGFRIGVAQRVLPAALALAAVLAAGCSSTPARRELALEWYELGNSWFDKSDWKRAGSAYSRAIALDASLAAASYNLARALAEAGDYAAALAALDDLAARDPGNVRVLAAKAYAQYKSGDSKAALATYEAILALDPYAADAVYNAAILKAAADKREAAAEDLSKLVAVKTEDSAAFLLLGRLQAELGRRDEAIKAFEAARALGKADAEALERLGILYGEARRFSEAMDTLAEATKADAKRPEAWFALARFRLTVAEDGATGLDALRKALDAGFKDGKKASDLLAEPVVAEREAVTGLLTDKGLVGAGEEPAVPAEDEEPALQ